MLTVVSYYIWNCPQGECYPGLCVCSSGDALRQGANILRSLCPAGKCDPKTCMCTEEVVFGIRDMVFGSADKNGSRYVGCPFLGRTKLTGNRTTSVVNSFAERLGLPKIVPDKPQGKDEL